MRIKHFIGNVLLPTPVANRLRIARESRGLAAVERLSCDTSALRPAAEIDLASIFADSTYAEEWSEFLPTVERVTGQNTTSGVNIGDRQAIYHLVRHFAPRSILEVGTHIGSSAVCFARALEALEKSGRERGHITTVDILDVNDPAEQWWLRFGSPMSAREKVEAIGGGDYITFVARPSVEFLDGCDQKFDFVFLDGSHSASVVYQELPRALRVLRRPGVVLLHDYSPGLRALWPDGRVIAGPVLGVERLVREGASMKVIPLGELPWPTKQGTSVTSLALVAGA